MSTPISNQKLLAKCREFIVSDNVTESLDENIKNALITASREISNLGGDKPLAWLRGEYSELFTRFYATISAITQASPGVITADSTDPDIGTAHGFSTGDLAYILGVYGMERLNARYYIVTSASDTTLTLTQLDGNNAINTTDYDEYDSGGFIYHAGILLPHATIQPTAAQESTASYRWKIKTVWGMQVDGNVVYPISDEEAKSGGVGNSSGVGWYNYGGVRYSPGGTWNDPVGTLERFRYWRKAASNLTDYTHYVRFYPPLNNRYNLTALIEKAYPDLSVWKGNVYPPHPPEIHDFIWHRALANLVTNAEKQRRQSKDGSRLMGQIEVLYAKMWQSKKVEDERTIKKFSRQLLGNQSSSRGWSG